MFPLNFDLATGGGGLSGGAATSGPATSGGTFGPVNIGGMFGSPASSSGNLQTIALLAAVALLGFFLLKKK